MKFSYSCRHKDINSQGKRIFHFIYNTHFSLYSNSFFQQSSGHPVQKCLHCTESKSPKLLILDNSISVVSFQLQGVIQEIHKLAGTTAQHLPAMGWPGACIQLSLYNKHRPKAFQYLLADIWKRDCL